MKSKLAQEDDPESRQKILNATLDSVVDMAEKDRSTLLDAIKDLKAHGYQGFLVGENFMKSDNPGETAQKFIKQIES